MCVWTGPEIALLKRHYRKRGASWSGWEEMLPTRSPHAISDKANSLGLRCERPCVPCHHGQISTDHAARAVASLDKLTKLRLAMMVKRAEEAFKAREEA